MKILTIDLSVWATAKTLAKEYGLCLGDGTARYNTQRISYTVSRNNIKTWNIPLLNVRLIHRADFAKKSGW